MCSSMFAQRLLCSFLLFCLTPGCRTFLGDRNLTVLVRDAETKQPITTAEVYLCQRLRDDEVAPCRVKGLTQADGIARLHADAAGEHGLQVQTVAGDYLPEKVNLSADALKKKAAAASNDKSELGSVDAIVDVYHEPNFSVELILPPGYRGLVKTEIQIQDNLPLPKGERCFRYLVSATGDVVVKGPSMLQRVPVKEFRARYGDGPLLGKAMDAQKVGCRWVKGVGNRQFFVVGTQLDYEVLHRQISPEETQAASGSWDDPAWTGRSRKYKYGQLSAPNYENKK